MKPGRLVSLVIGCLLLLPGIGMLLGGGALGVAYAVERDDDGYFDLTIDRLATDTVAITAEEIDLMADPGSPDWILDSLDADVRLEVDNATSGEAIFVGIADQRAVDAYLGGVAHTEVVELDDDLTPTYRDRSGSDEIAPPTDQDFWEVQAVGSGTQELLWEATSGEWAVVVMNADGSPGVAADTSVGIKVGVVLPLAIFLVGAGLFLTLLATILIVIGASGSATTSIEEEPPPPGTVPPVDTLGATAGPTPHPPYPLSLSAALDPGLSRWQWLVKWILAIPHFIVLAFLWVAFCVLTVVAGFAIFFTGRYPRGIFDFNVGVMRWSWRVTYYAANGGLGTDRYPPFSLGDDPDYPAHLEVAYPEKLSRGLVLVKWWLLAIPHYVIVGLLVGGSIRWVTSEGNEVTFDPTGGGGILGVLVLIAALILLFTGKYPRQMFDLIVGLNRWVYRVTAYAALMTDVYPPFRLDQGGDEPPAPAPPPPEPWSGTPTRLDLRDAFEEPAHAG